MKFPKLTDDRKNMKSWQFTYFWFYFDLPGRGAGGGVVS